MAYCRQPSSLDSGFGTVHAAFNGVACSSSDPSQDGHMVVKAAEIQFEPRMPPSLSNSSESSSVVEEAIEPSPNPRQQSEPPGPRPEVLQLPELSALDRRIALNNIEIATLMLNDSHERLAFNDLPYSESEPESAHEEKVLPTSREELRSVPVPLASRCQKMGTKERGHVNFSFNNDDERKDIIRKEHVDSSDDAEFLELETHVNSAFEANEAFA